MKKLLVGLFVAVGSVAFVVNEAINKGTCSPIDFNEKKDLVMENKIYLTAFFYLNEDQIEKFNSYKKNVEKVFKKHHVKITKKIKPIKMVKGTMALPDEIHFGQFLSAKDWEALGKDPDYQKLVYSLRNPSVDKLIVALSYNAPLAGITTENGQPTNIFAITIINYKQGEANRQLFQEYLQASCKIMPEFGAHFEHFLAPFEVKGEMQKPDKIHLFYMDKMEGFQQMANDERMQKLFPLRDKSVESAQLMIGKLIP